jgi:pimeloyl-ACP methyl ester carboxylesterase
MAKPTVVLIHGAFADASSWRKLYAELSGGHHFWQHHEDSPGDGLAILAPPNPLRGVTAGDGDYTKKVIAAIDGPVLLVGHSYGGAVITAAGTADNVVGLVYVAAFAPDEGEDLVGLQANYPAPVAGPYVTPHDLPDGGQEFTIAPEGFHKAFCADVPADEAGFMAVSQRPLSGVAFGEKAGTPAWKSKPSWAVLPTADGAIHPEVHAFSYNRMGAKVTQVEGASHVVMLSQPKIVADVIRSAVEACS